MTMRIAIFCIAAALALTLGCSDGNEADRLGVGAECAIDDDCYQDEGEGGIAQECLPQFAGGYCGVVGCVSNDDCPEASACVAHDDGQNYCFRICVDKLECNENRSVDNESNCSANIVFTDGDLGVKACVPPSSGV
jgi:hypothetical protein